MELFDGLLGNASRIDNATIQQEFAPPPIQKTFNKKLSIYKVQSVLAGYVLG